ncbi:family 16 glycoside hydrolase [Singulisphaera sp. Ch08]|uniref:Family 16 glycoside hydrolase n=1 Tax=Singulisphaera sp. Ch08 TaxID=3120278 RepID=A0AAU7CJ24_9BACT
MPLSPRSKIACPFVIALSGLIACLAADGVRTGAPVTRWRQHDIQRPKPPVVEPSEAGVVTKPPKDAIVLFDGTSLDAWKSPSGKPWKVVDGTMETVPGSGMIETKGKYGDIQLHIEWAAPNPPHGKGQDRGNSGIFLMGQFEIQVLDSYKAETYADGQAGAIYGQYPPLFNASRPPGEWQAFDIAFRRPRFDSSGALLEPANITVFHNGVLVQNNEEPFGPTSWLKWLPYENQGDRGPITLQDHNHPVRYRNIWLRELPERPAPKAVVDRPKIVAVATDVLDKYTGQYLLNPDAKPNSPKATIAREGDHLTISFPFRPRPLVLEPISETQFDMPYTDGRFTFHKDDAGQVTGVHFRIGDGERKLTKLNP